MKILTIKINAFDENTGLSVKNMKIFVEKGNIVVKKVKTFVNKIIFLTKTPSVSRKKSVYS